METRTIHGRKFLLPGQDVEGLDEWDEPPSRGEILTEVVVSNANWALAQIQDSTVNHSFVERAVLSNASISSSRLSATILRGADFSSSRWSETKIERCTFSGCSFVGANLAEIIVDNVIFDDCRFDYAYLNAFRATGGRCLRSLHHAGDDIRSRPAARRRVRPLHSRRYRFQRVRPAGCRLPREQPRTG